MSVLQEKSARTAYAHLNARLTIQRNATTTMFIGMILATRSKKNAKSVVLITAKAGVQIIAPEMMCIMREPVIAEVALATNVLRKPGRIYN